MTRMMQNIQQIRKDLEEKAEQTSPYDEIDENQLRKSIYETGAMSERSVRRYINRMKELGYIQEFEQPGEEQDVQLYKVEKRRKEDKQQDLKLQGDNKTVHLTVNKELLEKADSMGLNKSSILEKALVDQISDLEQMIENKLPSDAEPEEKEFMQDILMHDCYLNNVKDNLREEIYMEYFDMWNDIHCEDLRKKSAQIAEKLGMLEKPEGL